MHFHTGLRNKRIALGSPTAWQTVYRDGCLIRHRFSRNYQSDTVAREGDATGNAGKTTQR